MGNLKIRTIFAAVSDKSILDPLLDFLGGDQGKGQAFTKESPRLRPGLSIRFWGTEGTVKYLKSKGFDAQSVVAGFNFDGRVKSLDRAIFARILADRFNKKHLDALRVIASEAKQSRKDRHVPQNGTRDDRGSEPIDAVIVGLYPLDKNNFPESMDIGGQALIRAAIKNYKNVALAFDTGSLASLVDELISNSGSTTLNFRKTQAQKAAKFISERGALESSLF